MICKNLWYFKTFHVIISRKLQPAFPSNFGLHTHTHIQYVCVILLKNYKKCIKKWFSNIYNTSIFNYYR